MLDAFKLWAGLALGMAVKGTLEWLRERRAPWPAYVAVILGTGLLMSTVFSWLSTPAYDLGQRAALTLAGSLASLILLLLQENPTDPADEAGEELPPDLDPELQWQLEQAIEREPEGPLAREVRELNLAEARGELAEGEFAARLTLLWKHGEL